VRQDVIAATAVDWKLLLTAGLLIALVLVLVYRLRRKDPNVRSARYGFFVERDRFDDEPDNWLQLEPPDHQSMPAWQDRTAELPPNLPPDKP
jgi:hypothetical protein